MARAKLTPVNLATWEVEIWGIMVPGQPTKKSLQDPISTAKKKSWALWHIPVIPVIVGNLK
jgi:hypothetical protein